MDNKNTPNMTINIENIHIHLDERMFSKNFYNPTSSCCDECCGCDCEGTPEISDEELMERIHKETGVPTIIIDRILKAEDKVLAQLYADCVDDEDDEEDPTEDAEDDSSEEQTPNPNADKHPASEASKALAALAGLTLVGILRGIVSEEDKPHED